MIWHFLEVWVLMIAAFIAGSALGALIYDLTARSRLATVQGRFADSVGDVVDSIKARLGLGPVWRPEYRRVVNRQALAEDGAPIGFDDDLPPVRRPADAIDEATDGEYGHRPANWDDDAAEPAEPFADDAYEAMAEEAPPVADPVLPMRPAGLSAPRNGVPDNLQRIRGVGERNEALLNSLGIFHFGQIAAWTPGEVRWVGAYLAFPERIERDDWVGQATILASGGDTGFTKAADRRRARRLLDLENEYDEAERAEEYGEEAADPEGESATADPVDIAEATGVADSAPADPDEPTEEEHVADAEPDEPGKAGPGA